MSLPTHPLLSLVESNRNGLKSMLTHYIDATVDSHYNAMKQNIVEMIQSGQIGSQHSDVTAFVTTSPPPTQANTDQSSAQCSHEYSNDTLTRAQDHQNTVQQNVSLANTESMIKQEFNDDENEDGENIDDDNVEKCEKGISTSGDDAEKRENEDESWGTTQNIVHAALENNQTSQQIIPNDILPSPSPTNPINTEQLIKQEYLQDSPITNPLDFNRNDISIELDESVEGQNPHNQTDQFDDNDNVDNDGPYEGDENEYLNNLNCVDCANGDCDLHENNNHLSNDDVSAGDGDETDIETNFDEAQLQTDISVTNNTRINIQNDEESVINKRSIVSGQNMEQSSPSTSGVRSPARKQIQKKVFRDSHLSVNSRNGGKRKSLQTNRSLKKVKRKNDFDEHEDTDSDDNECTANSTQLNLAQPNRHWQCSHCLKSFDCNFNLQQHLRVHTGERPFQCELCDKRFKDKGTLTKHKLIHQNIKQFQCHECEKQFTHKHSLNIHLRTHSGERPFQCRHCAKLFSTPDNRNIHERAIHLHVKPYRCKQCGHSAAQRTNVIQHIRVVHFGLPRSTKEQRALNIIDERDPRELVEKM